MTVTALSRALDEDDEGKSDHNYTIHSQIFTFLYSIKNMRKIEML